MRSWWPYNSPKRKAAPSSVCNSRLKCAVEWADEVLAELVAIGIVGVVGAVGPLIEGARVAVGPVVVVEGAGVAVGPVVVVEGAGVAIGLVVEAVGVDTLGDGVVATTEGAVGEITMGDFGDDEEGRVVGTE